MDRKKKNLSPKVTRYICDFSLCENINMNMQIYWVKGSLSHDLEFLTQANVLYVLAKHCSPQAMTVSQNNITS